MAVTCDNEVEVYVNGALEAINTNWQMASTVHLGVPPAVVAIYCEDKGSYGGILAHLSKGDGTDGTWKCSTTFENHWNQITFDDSAWFDAHEIATYPGGVWGNRVSGMTGNAKWIWSTKYGPAVADRKMYCRKTITGWQHCD